MLELLAPCARSSGQSAARSLASALISCVECRGQALGVTQGSLSKALRVGRHVFVIRHESGTYEAMELRAFPAQGRAKQGASIDQWLEALCPREHQAA
ncbi:Cro/CI family transcriptional regulator [Stutzerimonas stutzeri]|uniref:Cro/CI family transcriptional regulator n=1 Tax=Stutzerimonas stutzeri TaxID=316 RepID=A0AA42P6Y2_STUST|nr:Cro/CI family transcriptional regulator [Stutzerimonas stutzeri]MDH1234452.1 Cro/CI family transcriptional regulator [Stutzerimonas stutzeri]